MALPVTHIQFAVDLESELDITHRDAYISGTVYPDSRYVSGIDRTSTHYAGLIDYIFSDDDFLNGWAVHFLCDQVQKDVFEESFSDLMSTYEPGSEEWWIAFTALKILQDVALAQSFRIAPYTKHLDHVDARAGEQVELVQRYNQALQSVYADGEAVTIEDGLTFWETLGLDDALIDQLRVRAAELNTSDMMNRLQECYTKMIEKAMNVINKKAKE